MSQTLNGVSETLLITLYIRAMESLRPDALIKDDDAVALFRRMTSDGSYDFSRMALLDLSEENKLVIILRSREFDRYAQDFLRRKPQAVVVHIGCGLDTRFQRIDNGQVAWYDLDLPPVIELRRQLLGDEGGRHHLLGCSLLDESWLSVVRAHAGQPFLFVAEGVLMYLTETQNKLWVRRVNDLFPGSELVFDAFSPLHAWVSNRQTAQFGSRVSWGIWRGREIESWGPGIRLLDEWGFFDCSEPRLDPIRWMRPFDALVRTMRIYHYQLGGEGD